MLEHGQTDKRVDTLPFHRPCSAYYANTVSKAENSSDNHLGSDVI